MRNRTFQVKFTQLEVDLISRTINVLSLSQDCHEMIVSGEVMYVLVCIQYTYLLTYAHKIRCKYQLI